MIQYCENSIMTSIMTFTFSDICKWRVTLVWQEMLTSSGTPDFICLPFGWQIHFAMSFCPFWHFGPYWLSMKVLCWYVWCHIFTGDAFFVFAFLYFNVVCFSCLSLSWYGMVIHFARELLAPSSCCALFLSYVMCTHDLWFLHGRDVLLFMWYICCLLLIMSGHGLWLWRLVLYAWHPIRWRLLLRINLYIFSLYYSHEITYLI